MKKYKHVAAPVSLGGLFPTSDDEEEEEAFNNETEIVKVVLGGMELAVRQMAWHGANANQIWPGAFTLMDYILAHEKYHGAKVLELGAATGALSLALMKSDRQFDMISSDIDDEGVVEENIAWNFSHNGVNKVRHIPHTWGTGWTSESLQIKFIFASDILLYVSAYEALVQTLCEIFEKEVELEEFLMCWNRRIAQSELFFDFMSKKGFVMTIVDSGVYSFIKPKESRIEADNTHSDSLA